MIGSIDHFVDQQILLWQEERRIRERKGVEGNVQRPTICVRASTARSARPWGASSPSGSAFVSIRTI